MTETSALVAEHRSATGKGAARKLRAAGRIPGVVYRAGAEATPVALDLRSLERLLAKSDQGINTLIDLSIQGEGAPVSKRVMVRELQRDPVYGQFTHADLYEIDMTERIEVEVPIHLTGKSQGVEEGGLLDHQLRELEIECLPGSIPEEIVVDVSALQIGDSLHVGDLAIPGDIELRTDRDLAVVSVMPPTVAEAEPTEEGAEPELVQDSAGEKGASGEEKSD